MKDTANFVRGSRGVLGVPFAAVASAVSLVMVAPIMLTLVVNTARDGELPIAIIAAAMAIIGTLLAVVGATELYRRRLRDHDATSIKDIKVSLIVEFGELERTAEALSSASAATGFMRKRTQGMKRWTAGDIATFYRILRVRNRIIGGDDSRDIDNLALGDALAATRQLYSKL